MVKIIKRNGKEEDVLACQVKVEGDLVVEISNREERHITILTKGIERRVVVDPLVRKVCLSCLFPSLEDNRGSDARVPIGEKRRNKRPDLKSSTGFAGKAKRESNFKGYRSSMK